MIRLFLIMVLISMMLVVPVVAQDDERPECTQDALSEFLEEADEVRDGYIDFFNGLANISMNQVITFYVEQTLYYNELYEARETVPECMIGLHNHFALLVADYNVGVSLYLMANLNAANSNVYSELLGMLPDIIEARFMDIVVEAAVVQLDIE